MFTPGALTFLRQLKRNNRREWFLERKPAFESLLLEPLRELVEELDVRLATTVPEVGGSPKRSIFRIYRDVRFSKDKSPYKTHVACWFAHRDGGPGVGSETHGAGAGFYFHLEPGASMVAGGLWMPPRPALQAIRERIATDHEGLEAALGAPPFRRRFGTLTPEHVLKRVPRPWPADHPAATWLRFASYTVSAPLSDAAVTGKKLADQVAKDFVLIRPLVRWLNAALGLRSRDHR
jgi:uncharacterized protein (TIGR02453 family)